ncbi:HNH endonuclease [Streptomyces sp. NPDC051994]|uniref:HNH endonuclease n=1 Tax=unclassified Streptomyces TaxID=2593676 RepID=UPI00342CE709
MDDLERFHSRWVEISSGCKIWQGKPDRNGYGTFRTCVKDGNKLYRAHRWIFLQVHGFLPEVVMHRCDTRLCVNWDGCLQAGTRPENSADMVAKGRQCRGEQRPQAKLTAVQVREIRRAYAQGLNSQGQLAALFGVSRPTVSDLISGRTWRSA